jgi:hypothetical protein
MVQPQRRRRENEQDNKHLADRIEVMGRGFSCLLLKHDRFVRNIDSFISYNIEWSQFLKLTFQRFVH